MVRSDWMSVMWLAAGKDTEGHAGDRYPALMLRISEKKFYVSFSMGDGTGASQTGNVVMESKTKMKLNKWYKWKMTQTLDSAGKVGPLSSV